MTKPRSPYLQALPSVLAMTYISPSPEETPGMSTGPSMKYIGTTMTQRNSIMKLLKAGVIDVPEYNGSSNILVYRIWYNRILEFFEWAEVPTELQIIVASKTLSGKAKLWYDELGAYYDNAQFTSFTSFITMLHTYFIRVDSGVEGYELWENLR